MRPDGTDLVAIATSAPYYFEPVFAADGRTIYVTASAPNMPSGAGLGLYRLDVTNAKAPLSLVLAAGGATLRHAAISRDGRKLAYAAVATGSNLWTVPSAGGAPEPLTHGSARLSRAQYSPDGTRIAYTTWRTGSSNDVWMMKADGSGAEQLTTDPASDYYPTWSADGQRLTFISNRRGSLAIFELSLKDRLERLRAQLGDDADSPRVSPDAKWIAYNSKRDAATFNVWVAALDGTGARPVTFDTELAGFPCWSPDSELVALEVKRGPDIHVAVVPRSGGTPEILTAARGLAWPWSFSPDGDRIAFAGQRDGAWDVYTVSRTTKKEERLTRIGRLNVYVRYPAFSPKGDRVVFEYAETTGNIWTAEAKKE